MINGDEALLFLRSRRSLRQFSARPIEKDLLLRLIEAATSAPSSTNRQPWRFAIVTSSSLKSRLVSAVREKTEAMKQIIRNSHHADEFGAYGDFFYEPLESAAAIIVPQYREYPDAIAYLLELGGGTPNTFVTPASMRPEQCSTSAAVMALLLQAHAEGLGACWMAGPTVAMHSIHALLRIQSPWSMLGAIALGYPVEAPSASPVRKPIDKVLTFFEDEMQVEAKPRGDGK